MNKVISHKLHRMTLVADGERWTTKSCFLRIAVFAISEHEIQFLTFSKLIKRMKNQNGALF